MLVRDLISRAFPMLLVGWVVVAQSPASVSAQTAGSDQRSFLLGTGATEGTYHPVGVALSTLVKLKLLPALNVDLTAINTDGSEQNVDLMRRDAVQFGIVSAVTAHEAKRGIDRFADSGPDKDLRAITTLWSSTHHVIVQEDAVQTGTIADVSALGGQSMSLGRELSGTLSGNRALLASLGIDIDSNFDLAQLDFDESAAALASGEITGMSLSGALPIAAVQDLFENEDQAAAFLEFNDEQLALIDQGRRVWARSVIPAETYQGQSRDIFTIGTPNILAVRADVDDEVVYQITKTIFENLEYLHGLHPATNQISLEQAVGTLPLPVHEGALRYFQEKSVELPAPPVEVIPDLLARFDNTAEARDALNKGAVTIFAGADGKTSSRAVGELADMLNNADYGFRLLPTFGGGSAQNLTDLLYVQGVDSALVRTDIVAYARDQDIYPDVTDKIAYLTEMFPEEVHLVTREGINNIIDLKGEKVDIGAAGSGTDITASIILSQLDIPVETTRYGNYAALEKLRSGEISAAFFVGGKPLPLLAGIGGNSGLKLMPIPFIQYADSYRPAEITDRDYPTLIDPSFTESVPTIAVRTALMTYQWRPGSARYEAISAFGNALFERLRDMHQGARHPKWWEVDPTAEIQGLTRFTSAADWLNANGLIASQVAEEGRSLVEAARGEAVAVDTKDQLAPPLSLDAAFTPEEAALPKPDFSGGEGDAVEEQAPAVEPAAIEPAAIEPPAFEPPAIEPSVNGAEAVEEEAEITAPAGSAAAAEALPIIAPPATDEALPQGVTALESLTEQLDDDDARSSISPEIDIEAVPSARSPTF
ncbi:MAG: TAXI family TRAP transporter solute-binding subunit [Geminicoccales bacterium]